MNNGTGAVDKGTDPSCNVCTVMVTVPNQETGVSLAGEAVTRRMAACGNVIPGITSVYRWKGEVQQDPEALVIFKTTEGALEGLKALVLELHPYELPEFLVLKTEGGHDPYLDWVREGTDSGGVP